MLGGEKMEKMKEPQIGDNFILMRRDRIKSTKREARKPKRRIDCFGDYESCNNPTECPVKTNCIRERIERIRRRVLGDRLAHALVSREY